MNTKHHEFDNAAKVEAWECDSCGALVEEPGDEPLYECGDCGQRFNRENSYTGWNHQCPTCHKFASKLDDVSCPECGEGEMSEFEAYRCPVCDELFDPNSWDEHDHRLEKLKEIAGQEDTGGTD